MGKKETTQESFDRLIGHPKKSKRKRKKKAGIKKNTSVRFVKVKPKKDKTRYRTRQPPVYRAERK